MISSQRGSGFHERGAFCCDIMRLRGRGVVKVNRTQPKKVARICNESLVRTS